MPANWSAEFDDLIPLPQGGEPVTLRDAGNYIATLPKSLHDSPRWQLAIKDLMRAATVQVEWRFFARLAIMKALYGKTPPPRLDDRADAPVPRVGYGTIVPGLI